MGYGKASLLAIATGLALGLAHNLGRAQSGDHAAAVVPPPTLTTAMLDSMQRLPGELSPLLAPPIPADNSQTEAKIELGKMLYFDTRLSRDYSMSCATCHDPGKAYSDGRPTAVGIGQKALARRSPSVLNAAYNQFQFWDGRASSLEEQARGPIMASAEMGMPDEKTLVERLQAVPEYQRRFGDVFGGGINLQNIAKAIAAFERTLVTPDSSFDRYLSGNKQALTEQQKRGLILFFGKAACTGCHNGPNLTDNKFYSLGQASEGGKAPDPGRFAVSKNPSDQGAFKTPSLRNVAMRPPYMHDGSMTTLKEVVDWYDQGGGQGPKSDRLFKLDLTANEKDDLLAFLQALNGRVPAVKRPEIPSAN